MAHNLSNEINMAGKQFSNPKKNTQFLGLDQSCAQTPQNKPNFPQPRAQIDSVNHDLNVASSTRAKVLTTQNSQIHGRKVDSPKIYVKEDMTDLRPKTSAQNTRKLATAQPIHPQLKVSKIKGIKQSKNNFKSTGTVGYAASISGLGINKESVKGRFDLNFQTQNSITARNSLIDTHKQLPEAKLFNSQTNPTQIQNKQTKQTSNQLLNGALSKYQQQRLTANSNSNIADKTKDAKISSTKTQRKRNQSTSNTQSQPKNNKLTLYKQISESAQNSANLCTQQQVVNLQLQVSSPQTATKTQKLANQLPPKQPKSSRADSKQQQSQRKRSTDAGSKPTLAGTLKSKGKKPRLNQTLQEGLAGLSVINTQNKVAGTNKKEKSANTPNLKQNIQGCKYVSHFSFELQNKENINSNSSRNKLQGPFSDTGKSVSRSRSRGGRSIPTGKGRDEIQNQISLSSLSHSSQPIRGENQYKGNQKQLFKKNYFLDGEQLLRQLSPGTPSKSDDHVKSLMSSQVNNSAGMRRERRDATDRNRSNSNQKVQKHKNHTKFGQEKINIDKKSSKFTTTLDKQQAQDLLKKFLAEDQKKSAVREKQQKGDERRKIEDVIKQKYKKNRSKSCISKFEHTVFSGRQEKQGDKVNDTCLLSDIAQAQSRRGRREPNCVLELTQLKKELWREIKQDGLISPDVMSGGNISIKNNFPRPTSTKARHQDSNFGKQYGVTSSTPNYTSLRQGEAALFLENENSKRRKETGKKSCPEINNSKIRKFIEKQKKKFQAKKSLQETIEYDKNVRIKQTLIDLQNFSRTGERPKRQLNVRSAHQINIKKMIFGQTQKHSNQQSQLLDHIRQQQTLKNLKSQRVAHAATNSVLTDRLPESSQFDSGEKMSYDPVRTYQQEVLLNDDSAIINIFKKELNSSNSVSRKQQSTSKGKRKVAEDDDNFQPIPLKKLEPKMVKPQSINTIGISVQNGHKKLQPHNLKPIQQNIAGETEDSEGKIPKKPTGLRKLENAFNSINTKKNLLNITGNITGSEFESLEPSRTYEDVKRIKGKTTPNHNNDLNNSSDKYEQSEFIPQRRQQYQDQVLQAVLDCQKIYRERRQMKRSRQANKKILVENSSESIINSPNPEQHTGQSIRKNTTVPQLNLQKIKSSDNKSPYKQNNNSNNKNNLGASSARSTSIFDRDTFQEQFKVSSLIKPKDDVDLPELQKLRAEEVIENERKVRQHQLQKEFELKKFSPRTFERKKQKLEKWVSMKKEEVKVDAKKAMNNEWEKTQKIMDNTSKDHQQVQKIIMSSGRSSTKQHNPVSGRADDHLHIPLSSVRTDQINSYRVESKRNSQRVQPSLIDLINERNDKNQVLVDSSSQSRNKSSGKNEFHTDNSHSGTQSQISQSLLEYDETVGDDQFENVYVRNNGRNWQQVVKKNSTEAEEDKPLKKNKVVAPINGEQTLKRVDSYTNIGEKALNKNEGRVNLKEATENDSETEIARQIMEVSPAGSANSDSPTKDNEQLIIGLRSDSFFMNKMEPFGQTLKGQHDSTRADSNNIRIEIGGENQNSFHDKEDISNIIGAVSPLSGASCDFGIQRGSMSLESSTSGENQNFLQLTIKEVGNDQSDSTILRKDMAAKAEQMTDEILKALLQELSIDFPNLVSRQELVQINNEMQAAAQSIQGIKTDLFAIEKYVDEVVEELKVNSTDFLRILNIPLAKDQMLILFQLQNSDIGNCEHFDETFPQVLPLDLYLTLEKRRKETRERNIQEQIMSSSQNESVQRINSQAEMLKILLAECEHIHNKVLFDCINDSLVQFKPYGKEGTPLPWSRRNRRLKPTDDFTINEIFEIVKHDLFRWAITNAGTLPRREFVYRGVFDEELFTEIREKKLVSLLAREMIESEPKWLNYEFEHAQVKIDVGDMILEQLVTECITILSEAGKIGDAKMEIEELQSKVLDQIRKQQVEEEQLKRQILDDLDDQRGLQASQDSRNVPADKSKYSDFSNNNDEDDWNL